VLEHTQPGSDAARRAQHIIERQVTHLTRLIDDLLDVTRIARGKIQLRLEHVELSELIWRTLEDHRSSFDAAGITLEAQPDRKICSAPRTLVSTDTWRSRRASRPWSSCSRRRRRERRRRWPMQLLR
jgi:signal transduction histidine kinase